MSNKGKQTIGTHRLRTADSEKAHLGVYSFSSVPFTSHHTTRISSLSMLPLSVDPSRSREKNLAVLVAHASLIGLCSG